MSKKSMRPNAGRQPRAGRLTVAIQERKAAAAGSLSETELSQLLSAHDVTGEKTIHALRLHFVKGLSRGEASARAGINASAITRAAHRFARLACPLCGKPLDSSGRGGQPKPRRGRNQRLTTSKR